MTSQEPIGAGKPVFIEHDQNQEVGMSGAARIKYRSGEEYIHEPIAEQMAEALRAIKAETEKGQNDRLVSDADGYFEAVDELATEALAAYEQAKGQESA